MQVRTPSAQAVLARIAAVTPDGDAGPLVRAARREADLSQRELAQLVSTSARTIARAETGAGLSVATLAQIVDSVGCRLVAIDGASRPMLVAAFDQVLDRGARHYPAHLDVRTTGPWLDWWGDLAFSTYAREEYAPRRRPVRTFDRSRSTRDWKRQHPGRPC